MNSAVFSVFYRCIPKVAADAINTINGMVLTDQDNQRINGSDVKEGQRFDIQTQLINIIIF